MVHIFLPTGTRLRLRIYPRPSAEREADAGAESPLFRADAPNVETASEVMAARLVGLCLVNRAIAAILEQFPRLGLRDWWLAADCVVQTVWNLRCGRSADQNIADYEIMYFVDDLSAEAENEVIRETSRLFAGLSASVTIRNQARVHLWYPEKFGIACSPLTSASDGILRSPSTTTAVGLKRTGDGFFDVYAPFGLANIWDMVVKPNRTLPFADVYEKDTARWKQVWPRLVVRPWVVERD